MKQPLDLPKIKQSDSGRAIFAIMSNLNHSQILVMCRNNGESMYYVGTWNRTAILCTFAKFDWIMQHMC